MTTNCQECVAMALEEVLACCDDAASRMISEAKTPLMGLGNSLRRRIQALRSSSPKPEPEDPTLANSWVDLRRPKPEPKADGVELYIAKYRVGADDERYIYYERNTAAEAVIAKVRGWLDGKTSYVEIEKALAALDQQGRGKDG